MLTQTCPLPAGGAGRLALLFEAEALLDLAGFVEAAEFDKFADEYLAIHTENLKLSGETPDYFARYKIDELRRRWSAERPSIYFGGTGRPLQASITGDHGE